MSDAARIIDKLTRTYPCTIPGCEGVAAMTCRRGEEEMFYVCLDCGTRWNQDGTPRGHATT